MYVFPHMYRLLAGESHVFKNFKWYMFSRGDRYPQFVFKEIHF